MKRHLNLYTIIGFIIVGHLGVLGILMFGNTQWSRWIYVFQAYYGTGHYTGESYPPSNYTGTWKGYYKSGKKKYVANYLNGLVHGKLTGWHENGEIRIIRNFDKFAQYRLLHGEQKIWDKKGKLIEHVYFHYHLYRKVLVKNRKKIEPKFSKTILRKLNKDFILKMALVIILGNGNHVLKYPNGKPFFNAQVKGGNRAGIWTWYYDNGQKGIEADYRKGRTNSILKEWDETGKLLTITKTSNPNKSNRWTREVRFLNEKGNVIKFQIWVGDQLLKTLFPNESGEMVEVPKGEVIQLPAPESSTGK